MIRTFRSKGLQEFFRTNRSAKIAPTLQARIRRRLDALDRAKQPRDLAVPGFDFHPLKGFDPTRYTIHVNGPWCITFSFEGTDAIDVDLEQYH